jgi:hypothetical protein
MAADRYDAAMTDDLELRASDADRDRAAAVLGGGLATGGPSTAAEIPGTPTGR